MPPPPVPDAATARRRADAAAHADALPPTYQQLLSAFEALERTLGFFASRGLPALYGLLQRPMEQATKHVFLPSTLAALLGVWPQGLAVRSTPQIATEERLRASTTASQPYDWLVELPPPEATEGDDAASAGRGGGGAAASAVRARNERARHFSRRLHAIAAEHRLRCGEEWDPELCPPPPEAPLPPLGPATAPAAPSASAASTARPPPPAAALDAPASAAGGPTDAVAALPVPDGCEGLPAELIEKIRRREVASSVAVATKPMTQRAALLCRLPELASALRACMREEKRKAMDVAELVFRLRSNGKWLLSDAEVREQFRMLAEMVPHWLTILKTSPPAVRIDNEVKFAEVLKQLEEAKSRVS